MRCFVLALVPLVTACGLESGGLSEYEGGASDSSPVETSTADGSPGDAAPEADAGVDPGPDASDASSCPVNACASASVPGGWNPVAFKSGATTCPGGFGPTTFVRDPKGTCACGCSLTSAPHCDVGSVQTYYSANLSCGTTGGVHTFASSGQCLGMNTTFGGNGYGADPAPLSGGTCSATPAPSTTTTSTVACKNTACPEDVCAGNVPNGYTACIETTGSVPCPTGTPFTQKIDVGESATTACGGGCDCGVVGTCTAAKIAYFSDTNCNNAAQAFNVTGPNGCQSVTYNGSIRGAKYTATVSGAACKPGGTSSATASLVNPHTICCKP